MKTTLSALLALSLVGGGYLWLTLTETQTELRELKEQLGNSAPESAPTHATQASTDGPVLLQEGPYRVTRVIDGDTIVVRRGSRQESVRLIGIDAPETGTGSQPYECFSLEATLELERLVGSKDVMLVFDETQSTRDEYSRLLAYVVGPGGSDAGAELLKSGYVYEYTFAGKEYTRQDEYRALEAEARTLGANIWDPTICEESLQKSDTIVDLSTDTETGDIENAEKNLSDTATEE